MQTSPEIVPKPWGYEYCAFDNGKAAVWILHIARGRRTSRHAHPKKRTRHILLQGEVLFDLNGVMGTPMEILGVHEVLPGEMHQTHEIGVGVNSYSENGAWVMEIEEPSDKGDIIRADDPYGRAGKPIESETVRTSQPLIRLSSQPQRALGYTFKLESTLGGARADLMLDLGGEVLGIYKEHTRRLADCVADFVRLQGVQHVFGVSGGGSMHLNDAFREIFVPMHHEQAAAMAAEAYGRLNGLGCALVTTGPGGTNAVTGVACAWVDSIPTLFISGQVTRDTLLAGTGMRQHGVQETDIVSVVKPITKYAVTVKDERDIRFELERAAYLARSGRPGPVWVDIPLDLQSKNIDWDSLSRFEAPKPSLPHFDLKGAWGERPVLVIGNGVHLAHAEDDCRRFVDALGIPVVSSWTAADIVPTDHPLYIGRFGIFGERAANFAVQNADILLVLGSRLSIPQTGHNVPTFARGAKIVMVDSDEHEMQRKFHVEHRIVADVGDFIRHMLPRASKFDDAQGWVKRCQDWKQKYPVVEFEKRDSESVNSYRFVRALSNVLPEGSTVITDMGTAFTCTFQAARIKAGQRWITASGHAPMGYGLPGAIGAHFATGRKVVCIVGDGALQFNLQELQTIVHHKLPIIVFVLNNGGYLTMKHTFANHFGRQVGTDDKSGLSCPSTTKIAQAYGLMTGIINDEELLEESIQSMLNCGQAVCEVVMDPMQPLTPRSSSMKLPDGSIASRPIEDLYPFLPREVLKAEMIVKPAEVLE